MMSVSKRVVGDVPEGASLMASETMANPSATTTAEKSTDFKIAVGRARERIGEDNWGGADLKIKSSAIYNELKKLDKERTKLASPTSI